MFGKKKQEREPKYINSPLNTPMLNYKVYVMSKPEALAVSLGLFVAGGLVGLIFYSGLFSIDGNPTTATTISNLFFFVVIGAVAVKVFTPVYVQMRRDKQQQVIARQFRDMLEALASSLSSGSNVAHAFGATLADLKLQYKSDDCIVKEVEDIDAAIKQGYDIDLLLRDFANRSGNEDIDTFADVFEVCHKRGGNLTSVLHRTHDIISEKMMISEEIRTKLTSNKMQHNVMSVVPIALVAMLRFTNDSFAENFATPIGVAVNTVAIAIFIGAYVYGRKIVEVKV